MSDLYSVISGIQPSQQDILEAELFAKQILEAKYPDLDLREGTGIRDLVIRPSAFLLALCKTGFDYYFSQNTLAKVSDTSPQELVDDLLSNLFLTRNTGSFSVINARLYFARQKSVSLTTNISFSTNSDLLFFPVTATTYPANALQFDSFQNEWFIDVDLIAGEKGSAYNISSGSLLYFSNFDPYFLHGEINYLSQASNEPETNLEFISRAKSSISTRNLINKPSTDSKLRVDLNYLNRILPIGAGEPEMFRDQINVNGSYGDPATGTSMSIVDSGTSMLIALANHSLKLNQLVDVVEAGLASDKVVYRRARVNTIIDAGNFKVTVPVSTPNRTFLAPTVTPAIENLYLHQGGAVDIYCSETVTQSLAKYTLDSNGSVRINGPVFQVSRSTVPFGDADTLGAGISFTTTYPGHTVDFSPVFTQPLDGTIAVKMVNHMMVVGRMVKIHGWPQASSNLYLSVSSVIDPDNFRVGHNLSATPLTVGSNLAPSITYTNPYLDTGFSTRQVMDINFGSSYAGQTCTMQLGTFDYLPSVQSYLELSDNRVLCADYLARGFDIYVLDINLIIYGEILPTSGHAATLIEGFLKSLAPGQDLILSDLVSVLTTSGNIAGLKTPIDVVYNYYTKDLFPAKQATILDVLIPENTTSIYILGSVTTALSTPPGSV